MSGPSGAAVRAAEEATPLQSVPGSGQLSSGKNEAPKIRRNDYRKLAIASIICGLSCVGIIALINSVKARERTSRDPESAQIYAHRARRFSLIAIAAWFGLLVLILVLMALVSYLLTLID